MTTLANRLWNYGTERVGRRNVLTLLLLVVIMGSVAQGISDAVRGLDMVLLWLLSVVAVFVGWWLGQTEVTRRRAALTTVGLGTLAVLFRVGRLDQNLWEIISSGARWAFASARWLFTWLELWLSNAVPARPPFPGGDAFVAALSGLGQGVGTLLVRTQSWVVALLDGASIYDPVAAAVVWGLVLWLAGAWAGWMIRRRYQPLLAVLPAAILMATALSYVWGSPYILLILVGSTLMLLSVVSHNQREDRWEGQGVDFSRDLRTEMLWMVFLLTLGALLLGVIVPSVSVDDVADFFRELTEPDREVGEGARGVAESLGLEQRTEPEEKSDLDRARVGGLPRRHLIGSGPELEHRVVLVVRTGDLPPMPEQALLESPPRYYWRSAAYDHYTGRGWFVGGTTTTPYDPGEQAGSSSEPFHRRVRQEVQVVGETNNMMHTAGQLITADAAFFVAWRPPGDIFAATTEAESYRADSLVPVVSEELLLEVPTDYPDWVIERYMQLPEGTPERVLGLARDLTATEPTPYERAVAIESYLRENYPYTLEVDVPPPSQDVVEYFLFDLRKGYCDYYATSMVVLARAAGLPARLAVGYASGTYEASRARYVVTQADAHAWVEVYFPGYGWIPFEPTAGRPPLNRPTEMEPIEWPEAETESLRPPPREASRAARLWYVVVGGVLALSALLFMLGMQIDLLWLRLLPPEQLSTRLYHRLRRTGERLRTPQRPGDTPYEYAAVLTRHLNALAKERDRGSWMAPVGAEIETLVKGYARAWYAPQRVDDDDPYTVLTTWRRLRWRLWLARLWQRFRRRRPAFRRREIRRPDEGLVLPPRPTGA